MEQKLTQKRLKELFNYDPDTGIWTYLKSTTNWIKVGHLAGSINKATGYRQIQINYKTYPSSRLAWLYMKGYFPEHDMDHINRIRSDDRWCNLRHVSRRCNLRNVGITGKNTSGIVGVYKDINRNYWKAAIRINKKLINIGNFKKKIDAVKARWQAEIKHGFPNCNSTSSAYLYLKSLEGTY